MDITKQMYENSMTSQCWAFTAYGEGWDRCSDLQEDIELAGLVQQEKLLEPLPQWSIDMINKINYIPFCPHASFPLPYLKMLDAIGTMTVPSFNYGCYTADRDRKNRMTDYLFCIDAWRAGTNSHQAAAEISRHGANHVNWNEVCENLWKILGEHSELKLLLISRILHRERWWIQALIWDDDPGGVCIKDQYLGQIIFDPDYQGDYGNPGFRDPFSAEIKVPEVIEMENKLSKICADWPAFKTAIHCTWLCAPKAFRYLEKLLWCVGKEKFVTGLPDYPVEYPEPVPNFLQCTDTYPNIKEAKQWMHSFYNGINAWIHDQTPTDDIACDIHNRLGEKNGLKVWLCGLFEKKVRMLNPFGYLPK